MTKLKPGDRVDCRIKSGIIVSPYRSYDEVRNFEIVSRDDYGYWLYVPEYYNLREVVKADQSRCKRLCIDKRFTDTEIVYIMENMVHTVTSILDGMSCSKCKEFFYLAGPNQEDGTLLCYSCRFNPYR